MKLVRQLFYATLALTIAACFAPRLSAQADRFEVTAVKGPRADLVNTLNALKKNDVAGAKAAFEQYDTDWNGIEVYINTRDRAMYGEIEQHWQAQVGKDLVGSSVDAPAAASDVTMMLAKYDEAIAMVQKGAPLNPLFDDVARLRIVRSPLRGVNPALKAGDFARARKLYSAFDDKWDSIEDLIKARSEDSYTEIERNMIQVDQALMPDKPDVDKVSTLVSGIMDKYNAIVTQITTEARNRNQAK